MTDHATHFLLVTILALVTILLIFAMKYAAATRQARSRVTGDGTYRDLAARSLKAQEENATALAAMKGDLSGLQVRLNSVEAMLRDVG